MTAMSTAFDPSPDRRRTALHRGPRPRPSDAAIRLAGVGRGDRRDLHHRRPRAALPRRHAGREELSDRRTRAPHQRSPAPPDHRDDVTIYAGATILGRITIGRGSSIGGNVWLTRAVPPGRCITQRPARKESFEGGSGI